MTAATDEAGPISEAALFGLARLLHLGVPIALGQRGARVPCPKTAQAPQEALEVKKQDRRSTQGKSIAVPVAGPQVSLNVTPETLEILQRLHQAGVINLGSSIIQSDERLTTWEYEDFEKHMVAVQKLRAKSPNGGRDSTAICRRRAIQFLEEHPEAPVQLRPPLESSWNDHVAYRIQEEGVSGSALNQHRKALKSLLRFLGLHWPSLDQGFEMISPHWTLPPDALVPRFWEDNHFPGQPFLTATIQPVFHFGFHVVVRPPSEICALDIEDVDFEARSLIVTEDKKGGRRRDLPDVEPFVMTASNAKSLKHYVDHVRPKRAKPECRALFVNERGERFRPTELYEHLSAAGKRIWPAFIPYTMRRWCATTRLLDTDFNVYVVASWLGDTVATVERHYLDKPRARAGMEGRFYMARRRLNHA